MWLAGGGCGWNLWVWLVDVVVRRYIDFLILCLSLLLLYLFCLSLLLLYLFFFCSSIPTDSMIFMYPIIPNYEYQVLSVFNHYRLLKRTCLPNTNLAVSTGMQFKAFGPLVIYQWTLLFKKLELMHVVLTP